MSKLNPDGKIVNLSTTTVSLDQAPKGPSETCWVVIDSNNKYAYAANFGLGTISSFEIGADGLRVKETKWPKLKAQLVSEHLPVSLRVAQQIIG